MCNAENTNAFNTQQATTENNGNDCGKKNESPLNCLNQLGSE